MAGADRTTAADLKRWLLKEARSLAFFQAVRMIRLAGRHASDDGADDEVAEFDWKQLRIRANLSLAFPESDIEELKELPDGEGYRLTANFFGLYGVSSPLPTFYTEDLLDEASQDRSAQRDFLDIIHFALYPLMYDAWAKYRNMIAVVEERNRAAVDRLFSLVGLADARMRADLPYAGTLLRYSGLFSQQPRSALGLETLLSDATGGAAVEVVSCVLAKLRIPEDQRLALGERTAALGKASFLGQEVEDRMGSITIRVGPVDAVTFQQFLPYRPEHNRLRFLVRTFLTDPVRSNMELVLERGAVQAARLGGQMWNQLGLDTWCFAGPYDREVTASFAMYR